MWIHLHIPKCAGGTIGAAIKTAPNTHWTAWPFDQIPAGADCTWIGGHHVFGAAQYVGGKYVTVLREPVDRLVSEFFYSAQQSDPSQHIPEAERMGSFLRFIDSRPHLNAYCQLLSAPNSLPGVADFLARKGYLATQMAFDAAGLTDAFAAASAALRSDFDFVGTYERLDVVRGYFYRRHAIIVSSTLRLHATTNRPQLGELPGWAIAQLRRKTEADRALYDTARGSATACAA